MFIVYLFRYIFGYVRVAFRGEFAERMLNLSTQHFVTLWDIEKNSDEILTANMSVKNYKRIRQVRGKSGVSVKIIKKVGLPFVLRKYSKRIGFVLGLAMFFVLLNFLSGFIWKIEVIGNERVSDEVILNACTELNIKEGTPIKSIDTAKAKEMLLIKLNGLAWASFNIEGSRLTVNVSEIKNIVENNESASDLFAKVDGVIKHIDVKSGNCLVKVGDAVLKDEILVSGEIEMKEAGIKKFVQSKAQIIAETKRVFTVTVPKKQIKTVISEKGISRNVLAFFSLKIPLYLGEIKKPYEFKTEENNLILFGEKLPLTLTKKIFYPTKEIEISLSDEEAKEIGQEKILGAIKNGSFNDFRLLDEKINSNENNITVTQTYNCEENIVYEVKIEENILQ